MANALTAIATLSKSVRRRTRQTALWAALLMAGLAALFTLGNSSYGLFDVDEAIFTQATVEMREATAHHGLGGLAMPTYNATPRYHKPPLFYWVQALSLGAIGENFTLHGNGLLAARLPSILSTLGCIMLLGFGVWHLTHNRRWALTAMAVLGLNLSFLVVGRAATADGLLNLTSLALTLWVLVLLFPAHTLHLPTATLPQRLSQTARTLSLQRWGWVVTGLLGTLAFLAKGPIAWFPAGIIALALMLARPNRAATWRVLAPIKVTLLIMLGLAPWFALLVKQHGLGFFYEFFMVHNVQRFTGDIGNSQSSFMGYYILVLMVGFYPWVAFLPAAIGAALRKGKRYATRAELWQRLASPNATEALPILALLWAGAYVLFFSFSGTKLAHYIVPAYPALALLVGYWLSRYGGHKLNTLGTLLWGLWGLLLAVPLALLPLLLTGLSTPTLGGWLADSQALLGFNWPPTDPLILAILQQNIALPTLFGVNGFWLAAAGMVASSVALILVRRGRHAALPWLAGLFALTLGAITLRVVPTVWQYTQGPLAQVAGVLQALPRGQVTIVHHGLHKPSLRLLSGQPFIKTDNPVQLAPLLQQVPEAWVVLEVTDLEPLLTELQNSRTGVVLDAKCTGGTCVVVLAPATATASFNRP